MKISEINFMYLYLFPVDPELAQEGPTQVNIVGVHLFKILKLKGSYRMDLNFVIEFLWKFCDIFIAVFILFKLP